MILRSNEEVLLNEIAKQLRIANELELLKQRISLCGSIYDEKNKERLDRIEAKLSQ